MAEGRRAEAARAVLTESGGDQRCAVGADRLLEPLARRGRKVGVQISADHVEGFLLPGSRAAGKATASAASRSPARAVSAPEAAGRPWRPVSTARRTLRADGSAWPGAAPAGRCPRGRRPAAAPRPCARAGPPAAVAVTAPVTMSAVPGTAVGLLPAQRGDGGGVQGSPRPGRSRSRSGPSTAGPPRWPSAQGRRRARRRGHAIGRPGGRESGGGQPRSQARVTSPDEVGRSGRSRASSSRAA